MGEVTQEDLRQFDTYKLVGDGWLAWEAYLNGTLDKDMRAGILTWMKDCVLAVQLDYQISPPPKFQQKAVQGGDPVAGDVKPGRKGDKGGKGADASKGGKSGDGKGTSKGGDSKGDGKAGQKGDIGSKGAKGKGYTGTDAYSTGYDASKGAGKGGKDTTGKGYGKGDKSGTPDYWGGKGQAAGPPQVTMDAYQEQERKAAYQKWQEETSRSSAASETHSASAPPSTKQKVTVGSSCVCKHPSAPYCPMTGLSHKDNTRPSLKRYGIFPTTDGDVVHLLDVKKLTNDRKSMLDFVYKASY